MPDSSVSQSETRPCGFKHGDPLPDERPRRVILGAECGGAYAALLPARQQHSGGGGETTSGHLPVWVDRDGRLRIAICTHEPEWAGDFDQIIVDVHALLSAISVAIDRKP